jgi:CheY-like chemotaxis protein
MTRILLVEDNADQRALLQDALQAAGYRVNAVADGNSAILLQRETPADVVVTDLFMPERDGLETIVLLRQHDPKIKIIAISGGNRLRGAQTDHLAVAHAVGADAVLKKPFDPARLIALLKQMLPGPS